MDEKRKEEEVLELTADEIDELVFEEQLEREKILTPTAYKTKQGVKTPHTEHFRCVFRCQAYEKKTRWFFFEFHRRKYFILSEGNMLILL